MPKPWPLYRLNEIVALPKGSRVYVTEGEPAADAVRSLGLIATTSPHGAKSAASADWSPLADHDVVILPDHDNPGERFAEDVSRMASNADAQSIRVVRLIEAWPEIPTSGDLVDFLVNREEDVDAVRDELESLANKADTTKPEPIRVNGSPTILRLVDVKPACVSWL